MLKKATSLIKPPKTKKIPASSPTDSGQKEAELTKVSSTHSHIKILVTSPTQPSREDKQQCQEEPEFIKEALAVQQKDSLEIGSMSIWDAVKRDKGSEVTFMLSADMALIRAVDEKGETPVIKAVLLNKPQALDALLAFNPDLKIEDKSGKTALHHAAEKGNVKLAKKLITAGKARLDYSPIKLGKSPIDLAMDAKQYSFVIRFMYNGIDALGVVYKAVIEDNDAFIRALIKECQISLHGVLYQGKTLLEHSRRTSRVRPILEMQQNNPEIVYQDIRGDIQFNFTRKPYKKSDYERVGRLWQFKEDLFIYLRDLIDLQESTTALHECTDEAKPLGMIMWTQRGNYRPSLSRGVLKDVTKVLAEERRQHVAHTYSSSPGQSKQISQPSKQSPISAFFHRSPSSATKPMDIKKAEKARVKPVASSY